MTGSAIRTPDQRLRVFVSSTLGELAEERIAVRAAVEQLRMSPIMFELGARPHPPRALYRSYLEQSEVFLGIYWQSYGWVAPEEQVSGLEDELVLSAGMPRLVYVKRPAPDMQPRLKDMLARLRGEDSTSYKPFADADELRRLVLDDLSLMLTERFAASQQDTVAPPAQPAPATPATTFVGREHALSDLSEVLTAGATRLVTLTGPGGTGKTRLALEASASVAARFPQGVVVVDLSPEHDPGVVSYVVSGLLLWMTGFPDRAQRRVDRGLELATEMGHPYTQAYALFHASLLAVWRHDWEWLTELSLELRRVADAHDYPIWRALSMVLGGTARVGTGNAGEGLAEVERGFALYGDLETPPIFWSGLLIIRATGSLAAGRLEDAARYLDEAAAALWDGDPGAADVEILRGELLRAGPDPDPADAVAAYERAVALAEQRGTRISHLQALTRLAELRRGTDHEATAVATLRGALERFTEGFDTLPVLEARRVLTADHAQAPDRR